MYFLHLQNVIVIPSALTSTNMDKKCTVTGLNIDRINSRHLGQL